MKRFINISKAFFTKLNYPVNVDNIELVKMEQDRLYKMKLRMFLDYLEEKSPTISDEGLRKTE